VSASTLRARFPPTHPSPNAVKFDQPAGVGVSRVLNARNTTTGRQISRPPNGSEPTCTESQRSPPHPEEALLTGGGRAGARSNRCWVGGAPCQLAPASIGWQARQCVPSLVPSAQLLTPSVQRHQPRVRRRRAVTTVSFSSRASRATTPAGTDEAAGHWADANFSPDRQPASQPASGGPRTSTNRRRRFAIKRCVRVLWMSGPHVFGAADLSRRPWRPMRSLPPSLPPSPRERMLTFIAASEATKNARSRSVTLPTKNAIRSPANQREGTLQDRYCYVKRILC
jgi:hypothetical protein